MWLVWVPLVALWMALPLLAALRDTVPWAVPAFAPAPPVLLAALGGGGGGGRHASR